MLRAFFYSFFAGIIIIIGMGASPASAQTTSAQPYDPNLSISYDDWNVVLKETVWNTGPSSRVYAPKVSSTIGTRLSSASQSKTRLEANKVFFHILSDTGKAAVTDIRRWLENIPGQVPLEQLSPNEQLAYWLNLRNVAVYERMMKRYPISGLRRFIGEMDKDKNLTVAGTAMSIRDIEQLVMAKWPNPLVAYGFYLGNIGSPNLMTRAFTGENVWDQLRVNAREFVSSLRGVQFDGNSVKVSVFYERVSQLFPDFEKDLRAHLLEYAKPTMHARIYPATQFRPVVKDWGIADLFNGKIHSAGSSVMTSPAGFILAQEGNSEVAYKAQWAMLVRGFPEHVQLFVRDIAARNWERDKEREGIVTIDEIEAEKDDQS